LSFVADSYDVFRFTDDVTNPNKEIRQILNGRNQKFVIRPDSGNPIEVLEKMIEIMEKNNVFDITINGKKASSKYGILWGDGINENVIENILKHFTEKGYAAENFVFGMGTQLGQSNLDRDTYSFAMKCSYIEVGGKSVEVFKDPITDKRKTSLKGKVKAVLNTETNEIECIKDENEMDKKYKDIMYLVYKNGKIYKQYTLEDIRNRIHNG
jgi:nicotinamide phosphoribosyltransferase